MNTVLVLFAMTFYIAAICTGSGFIKAGEGWKTVGITYGLLAVGITLFGIALSME